MSDERLSVLKKAYKLLGSREHSRLQLKRKLSRGFDEDLVELVLDELAGEGLQSDERYAESFVRSRIDRGHGPIRIANELREHGVDELLIDTYLDFSRPDWVERAREVRDKRFGEGIEADYEQRAKQARFLQYRGFTSEQIRRVLDLD
ncbi:MAG: regulatory protein RecX [Gammaproteobacteria bacterium]|nr:regulatory protein RecX [Gammaproteobacteria bacterium]